MVWILDLPGDRLLVASTPQASQYVDMTELRRSEASRRLPVPGIPDLSLTVGDILGPRST